MAILSSTSALGNELRENRIAANFCDYADSVDKDVAIQAKIECVTNEEETKYDLEQLRFKRKIGYCKSKVSHMYQNKGTVTFYIEVTKTHVKIGRKK
jgi:pyridoxine/pyridoxamine 5'-phosphate oxidase